MAGVVARCHRRRAGTRAGAGGLDHGKEGKGEGYIRKIIVCRNSTVDLSVVRW